MTHQHLGLDGLYRLEGNAHNDDDGGAADRHGSELVADHAGEDGQDGHDAKIDGAEEGDLIDDPLDEIGSGTAGPVAGNEAAVLPQVVGDLHRIVLNGRVEVGERDDQNHVDDQVEHGGIAPQVLIPPGFGVAHEGGHGGRQRGNGLGEDDGQNAAHVDLDGQEGVLAAVDLAAHHALGVADRDPALGVGDEHDEHDQRNNADDGHQSHIPVAGEVGPQAVDQAQDHLRQTGHDVGKQDHGDAVADAELGDLLTQPHNQGGARGEGQDDRDRSQEAVLGDEGAAGLGVGVLQHHPVGEAHEQAQTHGGVPGDPLDLLLAFLAALLGQTLQSGDGDGQQLDNDGCVDVGLDRQSEQGRSGERGAGHHVEQSEDGVLQFRGLKPSGHGLGVDKGNGNDVTDSVEQKDDEGEDELFPQKFSSIDLLQFGYLKIPIPSLWSSIKYPLKFELSGKFSSPKPFFLLFFQFPIYE